MSPILQRKEVRVSDTYFPRANHALCIMVSWALGWTHLHFICRGHLRTKAVLSGAKKRFILFYFWWSTKDKTPASPDLDILPVKRGKVVELKIKPWKKIWMFTLKHSSLTHWPMTQKKQTKNTKNKLRTDGQLPLWFFGLNNLFGVAICAKVL